MSLLDSFPHTCTIQIRQRVNDSYGGSKDTYTTVSSGVRCWRQTVSDREIQEYDKRGIDVTAKVYFTTEQAIDERHVLVISSKTYDVVSRAIPDASAGLGVVWRVMVNGSTTDQTV